MLHHADDEAGDDVDARDEHRRHRIALRELDGPVHRAVEVSLAAHPIAADACLLLVDGTGVQVGIDRHLAARQRVEREARCDFRRADRAVIDDEELNRDQDEEDDHADHVIAADHKIAERHDDGAGRVHAVLPMHQHQSGGGHVERQSQQGQQQEQRREDRELRGLPDVDHRQQQHDGETDVHREQQIEHDRRQRDDHQQHHRHHGAWCEKVTRLVWVDLDCSHRYITNCFNRMSCASTSATAEKSGPGIASPISAVLNSAWASGLFSTNGTPCSRARCRIAAAT